MTPRSITTSQSVSLELKYQADAVSNAETMKAIERLSYPMILRAMARTKPDPTFGDAE